MGVPRSIALNLTVPELVTAFNVDEMAELVARGPLEHPGARYIVRHDGVRVDLRYVRNKNSLTLQYGYAVERHLRDDDIIIFNRQPSLHKMSIMGHRVKVRVCLRESMLCVFCSLRCLFLLMHVHVWWCLRLDDRWCG